MADWTPQSRVEEILFATINGEPYDGLPQSRIEELLLELKAAIEAGGGGGGGGTTNYNLLSNLPQINGVTLKGNNTAADLNLVLAEVGKGLSTNDYSNEEKEKVTNLIASIQSILDGSDIDSFGDVEIALLDKADISDLGTAAAKDSTNAVISGSTDLVESGAVKDAIDSAVSSAYHHAGTKTVAQLTHDLLVAANEGNVYNITDSGTTTSDFIEGIGKTIDEGSNVGICKVGNVYMFDLLSGFVDTTNFVQKSQTSGLLKNDGTVNTTIEGDVATLKSGLTNVENELNGDATVYPYADVITIEDAVPSNLAECNVKIEPVQDLHGYDNPWVGGAGKNKCPNKAYKANSYTLYVGQDDDTSFPFALVGGTTYTLSFVSELSPILIYLREENAASGTLVNNTFTPSASGNYRIAISVDGIDTTNVSNIQLELGSSATDYEPYSNLCPISGHTEAVITRSDRHDTYTALNTQFAGCNLVITEDGHVTIKGKTTYHFDKYISNGMVGDGVTPYKVINVPSLSSELEYYIYDTTSSTRIATFNTSESSEFIIPSGHIAKFGLIAIYASGVDIDVDMRPIIATVNSISRVSIALGDTIYGGTVDFDSGVMTVDRAGVDMGTLTWTYHAVSELFTEFFDTNLPNDSIIGNSEIAANIISPLYKTIPSSNIAKDGYDNGVQALARESRRFITCDKRYSNAADYTNAVDGNILVYELATPTTIQLTPQQIQLLKGQNTITASTGQISVTVNGVSGAIGTVQEQVNGLATDKQDKTDNTLATTNKTVVGAINEHEGDISSLKSGLTNVTSETVGEITYAETGYISPSFIKKINGIKMFYLFIAGSAVVIPTGSWVTVCTLPTGFRSQNDINTVLVNPDLHPFMVAINSNGNVDIYNYTADTKIDGSYILTFI